MKKTNMFIVSLLMICLMPCIALSQFEGGTREKSVPTNAELVEITQRGRALAEIQKLLDASQRAVSALLPPGEISLWGIPQKVGSRWRFAYGVLDKKKEKFLISYETSQDETTKTFSAIKHDPPKEDKDYFLAGAKALVKVDKEYYIRAITLAFGGYLLNSESIKNVCSVSHWKEFPIKINLHTISTYMTILPADDGDFWVYVLPVPTKPNNPILGRDMRYKVSKDGKKIIEQRVMHMFSAYELDLSSITGKIESLCHVDMKDNIPEDTDVFHVLQRSIKVPQMVATKHFVFKIEVDGTIRYIGTVKDVLGNKDNYYPIRI